MNNKGIDMHSCGWVETENCIIDKDFITQNNVVINNPDVQEFRKAP